MTSTIQEIGSFIFNITEGKKSSFDCWIQKNPVQLEIDHRLQGKFDLKIWTRVDNNVLRLKILFDLFQCIIGRPYGSGMLFGAPKEETIIVRRQSHSKKIGQCF